MNDDFFNNLFNEDFFKKHMQNLDYENFLDENGKIDHDKLKEESFKMFEELSGKKLDDLFDIDSIPMDKLFPSISDNKVGMGFVQDLDSEEGKKMFDDLVQQHKLEKESKIIKMGNEDYIHENWSNKEGTVNVKRIYKLTDNTSSSMLSVDEQIKLYEDKLEESVEIEDYEKAAELRDMIKKLKNA